MGSVFKDGIISEFGKHLNILVSMVGMVIMVSLVCIVSMVNVVGMVCMVSMVGMVGMVSMPNQMYTHTAVHIIIVPIKHCTTSVCKNFLKIVTFSSYMSI